VLSVRSYRKVHRSSGHIWQGRFKAFPIEEDEHLLTVLRYVEHNALRAGLVPRAAHWPWCSLKHWGERPLLPFLEPGPVPRRPDWPTYVDGVEHERVLARLRSCVQRQAPFGSEKWAGVTVLKLGLESSGRQGGRPPRAITRANEPAGSPLFPTES
jgi:putative transposase